MHAVGRHYASKAGCNLLDRFQTMLVGARMSGVKSFVVFMLAISMSIWPGASGNQNISCRCLDSEACWPTAEKWDAFNMTIGGRLIAPKPTGYPCHNPHFDATKCLTIQENSTNAYLRAANPGSMQADNWEDKGTQRCAFEAPRSAPCRQGQVSILGVQVESVQDVQKAVKFASDHNLRIAVKSSGHDYFGRSAATGSFLIWMHKMKNYNPNNISIDYTFTATDKNCKKFSTPAVTVTGGVQWGEVYDALKPTGYIALGGMGLTICASGGYFQGGGHGVLGPSFGLAVDNILQIEVVTADGKFHITNACKEPDLFFALRGGGGGTFGIVTSVTYKLHRNPDNFAGTILTISPPNGTIWTRETQESVLAIWAKGMVAMDAAKWGGYWYFQDTGFTGSFLVPDTVESANLTITPVVEELSKIEQVTPAVFTFKVATFQEWHDDIYATSKTNTDATGERQLLGSRIIPYSALEDPSSLARSIVDAMVESGVKVMVGVQVIGPGVRKADPHGLTAVTPAWRTGVVHVVATSAWSWNSTEAEEDSVRQSVLAFTKLLQRSYPDSGAYFNEASIDEPGWKQSFWGKSNYAKLLAIKMRVDPLGLFTCRKCVGSELWRNSGTCRVP